MLRFFERALHLCFLLKVKTNCHKWWCGGKRGIMIGVFYHLIPNLRLQLTKQNLKVVVVAQLTGGYFQHQRTKVRIQ